MLPSTTAAKCVGMMSGEAYTPEARPRRPHTSSARTTRAVVPALGPHRRRPPPGALRASEGERRAWRGVPSTDVDVGFVGVGAGLHHALPLTFERERPKAPWS